MKNIVIVLVMILSVSSTAMAQQNSEEHKKRRAEYRAQIDAMKVGYFTNELELSTLESEKFWPLYNQYVERMRRTLNQRRGLERQLRERAATTKDIEAWIAVDANMAALNSEYLPQFLKVLGEDKTMKMFQAEEKFKQELLREASRRQKQN